MRERERERERGNCGSRWKKSKEKTFGCFVAEHALFGRHRRIGVVGGDDVNAGHLRARYGASAFFRCNFVVFVFSRCVEVDRRSERGAREIEKKKRIASGYCFSLTSFSFFPVFPFSGFSFFWFFLFLVYGFFSFSFLSFL